MAMNILIGSSLKAGLSIGTETLDLVIEEKGEDKSVGLKFFSEPFSCHGDKLDKESFKASLTKLFSNLTVLPREVSVVLPQNLVTTELLTFAELPKNKKEATEIVRWQASKNAYLDVQLFHCDYSVVSSSSDSVRVLSVLVDKFLMDSIEKTLFEMDVIVKAAVPLSIAYFNHSISNIKDDNFVKVSVGGGVFTAFVVKDSELVMFRTKPIGSSGDKSFNLVGEINATVSFYKQIDPDYNDYALYYFGSEDNVGTKILENITVTGCKDFELKSLGEVNALLAFKNI